MLLKEERELVVEYGKQMIERGLTVGTFGNLSVYNEKENLFAISPSGMDYFKTAPEDVVVLTPEGETAFSIRSARASMLWCIPIRPLPPRCPAWVGPSHRCTT